MSCPGIRCDTGTHAAMAIYSQRLGEISQEQFQAALERLDLGDFVRAEPVPSGLFGQNVFLTSTKGKFILRGVPHSPQQFPTEHFFTEQLHRKTRVPVAYPYLLDPSTDIFGWSYAIMPRLPGVSLANAAVAAKIAPGERLEIARAMALNLVEAHRLTWDCSGEYDAETGGVLPFGESYVEWMAKRTRQKLFASLSYNDHTTGFDLDWAELIITRALDARQNPVEFCIVFGDYGEHNSLVEHTPDGWRVSGVFDLMTAHFGDGVADLNMQVAGYLKQDSRLADEFVREYLRHRPQYDPQIQLWQSGFIERQQLYMLGLYASMWEYWQRARGGPPEGEELRFEQWAGAPVAYWTEFNL